MNMIVNPYALAAAGGGGGGWTPASLTDLYAWFDADQQPEANGAGVSTFTDQSGNGHDATTAGTAPLMATGFLNGKNALHFSASGTGLVVPSTFLSGLASAAIFFVAQAHAKGGSVYGYMDNFNNFSFTPYTDSNFYVGFGHATRHTFADPIGLDTPYVYGETVAVGAWEARFNGADAATATGTPAAVAWRNNSRYIGSGGSVASQFNGYIMELIFCNDVPASGDRQTIEGYLAWKYGLEANLPADHPYKSAAP